MASNEAAPVECFAVFAADRDVTVVISVARNPRAPGDVLSGLARSDDENVRLAVAQNPTTPTEVVPGWRKTVWLACAWHVDDGFVARRPEKRVSTWHCAPLRATATGPACDDDCREMDPLQVPPTGPLRTAPPASSGWCADSAADV